MTTPFKIVDAGRDLRLGLTATCITELVDRVRLKFDIDIEVPIRIVLEQDGTEIDDNDYFITLEPDTALMVLREDERWTPYKSMMSLGLALEPTVDDELYLDGLAGGTGASTPSSPVEDLVYRLYQDLSLFPWLTPREMDSISKMDTEEMKKVVPDHKFLDFLQDLSERYLLHGGKSDTMSDAGSVAGSIAGSSASGNNSPALSSSAISQGSFLLHDPIKLIRMYSKTNQYANPMAMATGGAPSGGGQHKHLYHQQQQQQQQQHSNGLKAFRSQ